MLSVPDKTLNASSNNVCTPALTFEDGFEYKMYASLEQLMPGNCAVNIQNQWALIVAFDRACTSSKGETRRPYGCSSHIRRCSLTIKQGKTQGQPKLSLYPT